MSQHRRDQPQDPRDRDRARCSTSTAARSRPRPAWGSSTTCSSCSAATAGSACGSRRRATWRPAPTTRSRTSGSRSARRSTARSATAPGSAATATWRSRWTRRSASARSTSPGRPLCLFEADLPPISIAGFDTELAEEFFRAVATNAKLTLHLGTRYGIQRAPHDRGVLQGLRARASRGGVDRSGRVRGPSTKGTLRLARAERPGTPGTPCILSRWPRSRSSTTGWATCGRSRRRSSGWAPRRESPATRRRPGGRRHHPPGRGRIPARDGRVRELELDALVADSRESPALRCWASASALQLLFERSTEHGGADGLGLVPGRGDGASRPRASRSRTWAGSRCAGSAPRS